MDVERRQRWAAFSVRAHRDLRALAADVLLYDKIVLPVPEDEPEYDRWVANRWDPDKIAMRVVQSGGLIIPVPWTAECAVNGEPTWIECSSSVRKSLTE